MVVYFVSCTYVIFHFYSGCRPVFQACIQTVYLLDLGLELRLPVQEAKPKPHQKHFSFIFMYCRSEVYMTTTCYKLHISILSKNLNCLYVERKTEPGLRVQEAGLLQCMSHLNGAGFVDIFTGQMHSENNHQIQ